MDIFAEITGIEYTAFLCRKLNSFSFDEIDRALVREATFILKIDEKQRIAMSWWVSAKRTRSYPYTRVYDSLNFSGKKITVIPILKDEGIDGDRDFLQWDTISLMSLLGVYVIISYYSKASKSARYEKITNQRFNAAQIKNEITKLLSYQSDALHWNLSQIDKVGEIGEKALECYTKISHELAVRMHSESSARKRIKELLKGREVFMNLSRKLAEKAQKRESVTVQPKEKLSGMKATLTIKNYLGGYYYFTVDEYIIERENVWLIEGKHTRTGNLPSWGDIKDGLLKMILFTNFKNTKIDGINYKSVPVLKLTTETEFRIQSLSKTHKEMFANLVKEAKINNFRVLINKEFIV